MKKAKGAKHYTEKLPTKECSMWMFGFKTFFDRKNRHFLSSYDMKFKVST